MNNNPADITIIGGGPTGLFAAFYAGLRELSTRIIDCLPQLGGQLTALYPEKPIYDMPGFPEVTARGLADGMIEQAMRFKPEVCLEERTTHLRWDEAAEVYSLHTDKGEYFTKSLLICTGAGAFVPRPLEVPDAELYEGTSLLYFVKQLKALEGKKILIVGGGDSAVDWALAAEPLAESVTLIHRRDTFRAHEHSLQSLTASRVKVLTFTEAREIHGEAPIIHGITVQNTKTEQMTTLDVDTVLVNIGFLAGMRGYESWGLNVNRSNIYVDEYMATNLPMVYSAGDVTDHPAKLKLIATAVGEAAIAVNAIKMKLDSEAKFFPGHSTDLQLG